MDVVLAGALRGSAGKTFLSSPRGLIVVDT